MTVIVGAASPEGVVLGSDSRTTLSEGQRHRIRSDFGEKVFAVHGRFGVATYGIAGIGEKTIAGLMQEFIAQDVESDHEDGAAFARRLGDFFDRVFREQREGDGQPEPEQGWVLGFLVAGYDDAGIGHIWEVGVPGPTLTETPVTTAALGVLWRGQTDVIRRLIKGFDADELQAAGVDVAERTLDELRKLEYILLMPITLQDACDFTSFLIRTTIDMQRFSDGTSHFPGLIPACGGAIQLLAVTGRGVEWISRARLTAASRPGWAEGAAP